MYTFKSNHSIDFSKAVRLIEAAPISNCVSRPIFDVNLTPSGFIDGEVPRR